MLLVGTALSSSPRFGAGGGKRTKSPTSGCAAAHGGKFPSHCPCPLSYWPSFGQTVRVLRQMFNVSLSLCCGASCPSCPSSGLSSAVGNMTFA